MNCKIKIISTAIVVLLTLSALTACEYGNSVQKNTFFDEKASDSVLSDTVASNKHFELYWDDDGKFLLMKNLSTGKIWSTIPYEYYIDGGTSANVNSTLNITVSNAQTLKWDTVNGFSEAYMEGRITSEKIENGIKVTYFFDKFKISVPVEYRLREDSLQVSVDPKKISEGGDYLLVAVSPAPFLCAARNSREDSYLFVPTGSGALMYTDERSDGDRLYSGEIYGDDAARMLTSPESFEEAVRMPVFGARDGKDAMFGIIENGSESATINATAGNSRTGYSNIFPTFYLRGYDKVQSGIQSLNYEDITKVSEDLTPNPVEIGFYPLSDNNADYMGMVKCYQKYLSDKGCVTECKSIENTYGVNIYGGTLVEATILGIPSEKLHVMTTFRQALDIITELSTVSDMKPEILLSGFGDSGVNPGKIAGGFDYESQYGSKNDKKKLEDYCQKNHYNIYTDFDLVRFSRSGSGFNYIFDSAKSPSLQAVEKSPVQIPLIRYDKRIEYRLLKRNDVRKAVKKLINSADKLSVSGIGLSSVVSLCYSDYSDSRYYSKGNTEKETVEYIKEIQKSNHKIAVSQANAYAAAGGDSVFNAPVNHGDYFVFDDSIPFYEMVFVGTKPVFSAPLNVMADYRKQIMLSVSSGAKFSFSLVSDFEISDLQIQSERFYACVFRYNKSFIEETLKKYGSFYEEIEGESILSYEILTDDLSKTVFENGVTVYANHGTKTVQSPLGKLDAYEVSWTKK